MRRMLIDVYEPMLGTPPCMHAWYEPMLRPADSLPSSGNNTFADELPRPGKVTSVNNHFVTVDFVRQLLGTFHAHFSALCRPPPLNQPRVLRSTQPSAHC